MGLGYLILLVFLCSLVTFKACNSSFYTSIRDINLHPLLHCNCLHPYELAAQRSLSEGNQVIQLSASKLEYY